MAPTIPARPAERYGRPRRGGTRAAVALAAVLAAAGVAFCAWAAFSDRPGVHWTDIGFQVRGDTAATATFEVTMDRGRSAVCTVRALNRGHADVGRAEIRVGPSRGRPIRVTAEVPTSERAVTALVKECAPA